MRGLFWVLTCLLFLLLGITLSQWLPLLIDARLPTLLTARSHSNSNQAAAPPTAPVAASAQPPASAKAQSAQAPASSKATPAVAAQSKADVPAPPRYRLVGIITASGEPPQLSAVIAWVEKQYPAGRYAKGDELPDGGSLIQVTSRQVSIAYKDHEYLLKLRDQNAAPLAESELSLPQPAPPPAPIAPSPPPAIFGFNPADHADPQAAFTAWYAEVRRKAETWQGQQAGAKAQP